MKLNNTAIPYIISVMVVSSMLLTACIPGLSQENQQSSSTEEQSNAESSTQENKAMIQNSVSTSSNSVTASDSELSSSEMITKQLSYSSPAGQEHYKVSLSIEDAIITSASVEPQAEHPISNKYQKNFAKELSNEVIGKKVSEVVELDRIGGASLTTEAFTRFLGELNS